MPCCIVARPRRLVPVGNRDLPPVYRLPEPDRKPRRSTHFQDDREARRAVKTV